MVADRTEQVGDVAVVQAVVSVPAGAANGDETPLPEQAQLVRGRARGEPGRLHELLHRALAGEHRPEQPQATAGTEHAHCLCKRFRFLEAQWPLRRLVFGRMGHCRIGYQSVSSSSYVVRQGGRTGRWVSVPAVVVGGALAAPGAAFAHGIHPGSSDSVPDFVRIGFLHMLTGYDHLLFAAGVVLLAGQIRRAPKLISLFVAGHSLTLLIATLAGWRVSPAVVDVVLALSVAWVGLRLLQGRPERWRATEAAIFGFGLVHGLGLSTRLQDLQLPGGGDLVARILAFNVGVELGQLAALTAIVGVALLLRHGLGIVRTVEQPVGRLLAVIGVAAAATLGFSAAKPDTIAAAGRDPNATCGEQPRASTAPVAGTSGHPERLFYRPGEAPPERNLAHVLGDGYVVVRYRASIPGDARDALAQWSAREPGVVVVPTERADAPVVEATSSASRFACNGVNVDELSAFRERWTAARRRASTQLTG